MKKSMNENDGNCLDVHVIDLMFGRTCLDVHVIVFVPIFVIVSMLVCAIVRFMLSTTCEETTVWVAILTSTVGYFLHSPEL